MPPPNKITPSRLHAPPRAPTTSQSVCGGPPLASIFISLSCAKYAIDLLSGDQNGNDASSVPGSGCAVSASIPRIQSENFCEVSRTVNTSLRPSGEIDALAPGRPPDTNEPFSGGSMKKRTGVGVVERARYAARKPPTAATAIAAVATFHQIADCDGRAVTPAA